jgi:hypothetical protein
MLHQRLISLDGKQYQARDCELEESGLPVAGCTFKPPASVGSLGAFAAVRDGYAYEHTAP